MKDTTYTTYTTYIALRKLELALASGAALKELAVIAGDALGFTLKVSQAIDAYEEAYPELKG